MHMCQYVKVMVNIGVKYKIQNSNTLSWKGGRNGTMGCLESDVIMLGELYRVDSSLAEVKIR